MDLKSSIDLALAGTGTIALVISTLTLKEMRAQRLAQLRPVLFIGTVGREAEDSSLRRVGTFIRLDAGSCDHSLERPLYIYLANVGTSPALDITLESFGDLPFYFDDGEEGHWFALAPSEAVLFEIRVRQSSQARFGAQEMPVRFRFTDAAGTPYQADADVQVMNTLGDDGFVYRLSVTRRHAATRTA